MRIAIAILFILTGTTGGVAADPPAGKPVKDRLVCRAGAETGSLIRNSECHKTSEWVAIDEARRAQYEDMQRRFDRGSSGQGPTASSIPQ